MIELSCLTYSCLRQIMVVIEDTECNTDPLRLFQGDFFQVKAEASALTQEQDWLNECN